VFDDEDEEPTADGKQFDAVGKYEEPEEPGAGDIGPSIPDTAGQAANAPPKLRLLFWRLVVLFNVALVAVAVGVMLIAFGTDPTLGTQVLLVGLVLSVYGYYRYREAREEVGELVGTDAPEEDNG